MLLAIAGVLWVERGQVAAFFKANDKQIGPAKSDGGGGKIPPIPIIVAEVTSAADTVIVSAIGTARAMRSVILHPVVSGEILDYTVQAGDTVKKGDRILRLDDRMAKIAVEVAQNKFDQAKRNLERETGLMQRSVGSQAQVDDAQSELDRATLDLRQAKETLADLTLLAPFDGIVGIPQVEIGDRVNQDTEIVSLDDRADLLVEFQVAERFLARIQLGMEVIGRTPSYGDREIKGVIERVDSRVDPQTRMLKMRAKFPNSDDLFRPGMSFIIDLVMPGGSYPTVPELALQWRKGESYVWRIVDNKAEKLIVRTVRRRNAVVLVDGDLREGDLVVIEGVQRLRPGRDVDFTLPATAPGS